MTLEPTTHHTPDGEGRPLALIAIEPRSYAEAIGGVVAQLRPGIDALVVHPGDLLSEMGLRKPDLVLCGEEKPDGPDETIGWAEYSPYEDPDVVRVDGRAERIPGLTLEDLLGLVDRFCATAAEGAARVTV